MKTSKTLLLNFVFCFTFLFLSASALLADNTISGTVRYSDNNELVTTGIVKAYSLTGVLLNTASIHPDGSYMLTGLQGEVDIIGLANIEPEDNFLPTCYPDQIDPQLATDILAIGNIANKNIFVERTEGGNAPFGTASVSGKITYKGKSVKDAVVYAQVEGQFNHFSVTSEDGSYEIENLPEGDYILVVHRIGYNSIHQQIHIKSDSRTYSVFELASSTLNITENLNPKNLSLNQNYPNPFNPSTIISYNLPVSGKINLSVYNSAGQVVKELVNQFQNAGTYSITLDGTNLSSGIYFYKLESGQSVQTKRMSLVK